MIFRAALLGVGVPAVKGPLPIRLNARVEPPLILRVIVGFNIVVNKALVIERVVRGPAYRCVGAGCKKAYYKGPKTL